MAQEIERKFLVSGEFKREAFQRERVCRGYLSSVPERVVRVRVKGEKGYLTVKGKSDARGMSRYEWEQEIAVKDAWELLELCEPGRIDKTRYWVKCGEHVWEVDEFHGDNEGLVVAEVELGSEEEEFERPAWLGQEVTGEERYYNAALAVCPYRSWQQ